VREGKSVTPALLFATLLWHEVLATWNAAKARGERPMPALFEAMDKVLEQQQAQRLAIPRRFEAAIKEIWALQPRFSSSAPASGRSAAGASALSRGLRFRALRCDSGDDGELAGLADWWEKFQHGTQADRDALLRPDEGPQKKRRSRGRGRKRGDAAGSPGAASEPAESSGES
jgi:poly(A) polymerase